MSRYIWLPKDPSFQMLSVGDTKRLIAFFGKSGAITCLHYIYEDMDLVAICHRNRLTSTNRLHQAHFLDKETEAWQERKYQPRERGSWAPVIHLAPGFLHPSSFFLSVFQGIVPLVCTKLVGGRHHGFDWYSNLHLKASLDKYSAMKGHSLTNQFPPLGWL